MIKIIDNPETGYAPFREYAAKIKCENCGNVYYIAIPKGELVNEHLQMEECPNCGCKDTLRSDM